MYNSKHIIVVESTLVLNDDYDNLRQTTTDRKGIKNDIMVTALLLQYNWHFQLVVAHD